MCPSCACPAQVRPSETLSRGEHAQKGAARRAPVEVGAPEGLLHGGVRPPLHRPTRGDDGMADGPTAPARGVQSTPSDEARSAPHVRRDAAFRKRSPSSLNSVSSTDACLN